MLPATPAAFLLKAMTCSDVSNDMCADQAVFLCQVASGDESPIPWNFAKFLVRRDGTVAAR